MTATTHPSHTAAQVQSACIGPVVASGDAAYDAARLPWHVAIDQRPALVAFPDDAADVASAVIAARQAGLRIAVQGTGHGAHQLGDLSDAMLIRTSSLKGVVVDPVARTARVCAGAVWEDVVTAAAPHGLAPLAGSSPDVGVVGFTLGGGIGYLSRKHGLACNHVRAIELVTPEGELVRADAVSHSDAFWALRGGGGAGVGVVCALEIALVDVPALYAGALFWPWERAAEVLEAWRALTASAPEELTSMWRLLQLPPLPEVPEPLRGRAWVNVQVAFLGDAADGAELLAPLRALGPELDLVAPMPPEGLLRLHGDPEGPTLATTAGALLDELPPSDVLLEVTGAQSGSPLAVFELRHLGGALDRAPAGAGALATIGGAFALHTVGVPAAPELGAAIDARNAELLAAVAPYRSARDYLNFAAGPLPAASALGPDAARRLAAVQDRAGALLHTPMTQNGDHR